MFDGELDVSWTCITVLYGRKWILTDKKDNGAVYALSVLTQIFSIKMIFLSVLSIAKYTAFVYTLLSLK